MALISLGPLVGEARGKIGGVVLSHSRAGPTARVWSKPVDPCSAPQQNVRGINSTLHKHWIRVLTNTQRIAWNTLATHTVFSNRLGKQFHLSGQQLFIRNNGARLNGALPIVDDAPANAIFPTPQHYYYRGFSVANWYVNIEILPSADPTDDTYCAVSSTAFLGQTVYRWHRQYIFRHSKHYFPNLGTIERIEALIDPPADSRVFFRTRFLDVSGAVSAPAYQTWDR